MNLGDFLLLGRVRELDLRQTEVQVGEEAAGRPLVLQPRPRIRRSRSHPAAARFCPGPSRLFHLFHRRRELGRQNVLGDIANSWSSGVLGRRRWGGLAAAAVCRLVAHKVEAGVPAVRLGLA
jgi:hypothetical protein